MEMQLAVFWVFFFTAKHPKTYPSPFQPASTAPPPALLELFGGPQTACWCGRSAGRRGQRQREWRMANGPALDGVLLVDGVLDGGSRASRLAEWLLLTAVVVRWDGLTCLIEADGPCDHRCTRQLLQRHGLVQDEPFEQCCEDRLGACKECNSTA